MTRALAVMVWLGSALIARAEPAMPLVSPRIDHLEFGIFCTPRDMGQALAPGTQSGIVHVPQEIIAFTWTGRQVVPAEIGLAFGVMATLSPGNTVPYAEIRVHVPGRETPDIWGSSFSDFGPTLSFFSLDRTEELIPGIWRFEAWDAAERLYAVEFEVVPPESQPGLAGVCGAVS